MSIPVLVPHLRCHIKVAHHALFDVLQDVAVIHPAARIVCSYINGGSFERSEIHDIPWESSPWTDTTVIHHSATIAEVIAMQSKGMDRIR